MTQITWTKCSERMPPDGLTDILLKQGSKFMRTHGVIASVNKSFLVAEDIEWTPYTPEIWEELNRC